VPLSGADNEPIKDDMGADLDFFQEAYHAKSYSPIGKKKIFVTVDARNERLRTDLNVDWTPTRMEQGAFSPMSLNKIDDPSLSYNGGDKVPAIGAPIYIPDANSKTLYGSARMQVDQKGYDIYFRPVFKSDLIEFDIGGGYDPVSGTGADASLGRSEQFIFHVPGPSVGYLTWDGFYDESNIRIVFKNIGHFQFILGGMSYMQFYESAYYKQFTEDEKELFSSTLIEDGGVGQMLGDSQAPNRIYRDYFFELETPYTPKECKLMNTSAKILQGDISSKFLFHSTKYQEIASIDGLALLQERQLPCFYSYLSEYTAMQDSLAIGGKGPKKKNKSADGSDYSLGGHYDQLTLGGLLPYDSIPFFTTKPGHQKLSKVDLVDLQWKQSKGEMFRINRGTEEEIKQGYKTEFDSTEYSDSYNKGAPYFENFARAFPSLISDPSGGEYDEESIQAGYAAAADSALATNYEYLQAKAFHIQEYNKSIIFTRNNMKYARDYNDKITAFPMHVRLEIPNGSNSKFGATLETLGLEDEFLDMVVSAAEAEMNGTEQDPSLVSQVALDQGVHNVVPPGMFADGYGYEESFEMQDQQSYRLYDIDAFITSIQNGTFPLSAPPVSERNYVGPGGYHAYSKTLSDKKSNSLGYQDVLKSLIFKSKIENFQKNNFRSYKELLFGKPAYKEIVGYRVAKHLVSADGAVNPFPIQNMFFMNKEDVDKIVYYDTQLKYKQKYKYVVYAYVFVIGNKYTFPSTINWNVTGVKADRHEAESEANSKYVAVLPDDPNVNQDMLDSLGVHKDDVQYALDQNDSYEDVFAQYGDVFSAKAYYKTVEVYNMVSPVVIEIPYYDFSGDYEHQLIMDDPPLHPQVTFTPYREINNRLLITLETTTGDYSAKPVAILPEDDEYFDLVRLSQNKSSTEPVDCNAEDSNSAYQVFRIGPGPDGITQRPFKYADFEEHLHLTNATNTSLYAFDDTLERNKVYYYTFRAIDRRQGLSNPSPVYKVEMVGDPDYNLSYPRISVYNFEDSLPKKQKKTLRRYLHINPALEQITVDEEKSGFLFEDSANTIDAPVIGVAKESMVGNKHTDAIEKKFKIRLTSKSTGRKIDFNVKFVHRHVKNV